MATVYQSAGEISFSSKARYKLTIMGYLDSSWSERLGGLIITANCNIENKPTTTLEGDVADQAELIGIINSIYEMHLPILSVSLINVLS